MSIKINLLSTFKVGNISYLSIVELQYKKHLASETDIAASKKKKVKINYST